LMNPLQYPYPTTPHPFLHPLFSWQLSPPPPNLVPPPPPPPPPPANCASTGTLM
jgi:hypothetical protein